MSDKIISYVFTPDRVTRETINHDGTLEPLQDVSDEFVKVGRADQPRWRLRNPLGSGMYGTSDTVGEGK